MPEALSQDEVDALLNLVQNMNEDEGGVAKSSSDSVLAGVPGMPGAIPTPIPGFEQYNALPSHQINVYDFKRPERVSKSQVIALEALHEVFARNVSASPRGLPPQRHRNWCFLMCPLVAILIPQNILRGL